MLFYSLPNTNGFRYEKKHYRSFARRNFDFLLGLLFGLSDHEFVDASSYYSRTLYGRIYSPGYYTTNTRYFWESNLYDLSDGKLIYSAQSQSFEPSTSERLGKEYGKLIVDDILGKGVVIVSSTPSTDL